MKTNSIKPIERQPIAEHVARQLLALVQSGNLQPGEKLPPERELAATLMVSRPSLREALRALSLLGVLRIRQGGGVYVSSLDPESLLAPLHFFVSLDSRNLEDLFEARMIIESQITRIATTKMSPDNLAVLEGCVDFEINNVSDVNKFIESDVKFHQTLFETADNAFLQSFATSLHVLGKTRGEITASIPNVMKQSLKDHKSILKAIKAKDPDAAADAMKQHVIHVRNAYRNLK